MATAKKKAKEPVYKKTKSGRMARYVKNGDMVQVYVKRVNPYTGAPEDDEAYWVDIPTLTEQRNAHLAEAARLQEEIDEATNAEEPEEPTNGEPT